MIGVAVFLIIPWLLGFALYDFSYWWPIMFQSLTLLSSMSGAVLVNYATEGRQKAFIKNAFKHYLSPAVIEQIMANPDQLKLGGERRCLSIFFSDLAGFSTISEKLEPQALTQLLNDYLTDMTDIILEEGGTLDKYEGDAIIAFWNAPLHQQDHALRAARTALRCQRKLAERRAEFEQRSGVVLSMRIGVNTGDVVVGNMGSRERFDYTVLGDAANLAARLEGANKYFGTATMIAESTWVHGGNALVGREIGRITVVGRRTPERVYEVLGMPGESASVPVDEFERGIRLCESGQWQEAAIIFEQWPHDALSCRYASRCRELCSSPTAAWDGVWNLAEK
jgi:adenylate cyclase